MPGGTKMTSQNTSP